MAYSDKYFVAKYGKTNKLGIKEIKAAYRNRNGKELIIEVPNTTYLSKELLNQIPDDKKIRFRIAGPYNDYMFKSYKGFVFDGGEKLDESFFDGVIYTKDEVIKIIEKLEEIEMCINPYWSDLQKAYYIFDYLRTQLMYNPNYKIDDLDNITGTYKNRSLRGLINGNTICAGYSVIYMEILRRLGLKCQCVLGEGHMWNAIKTEDGRVLPLDVTWGNTDLRKGRVNSIDYFAQNKEEFKRTHTPWSKERVKNDDYSELTKDEVNNIRELVTRGKNFSNNTYRLKRSDGSLFTITQINNTNNGQYMYVYQDVLNNNTYSSPKIIVTENNISKLINTIRFYNGNPNPTEDQTREYKETRKELLFLSDNLFSSYHLNQMSKDKTIYLGSFNYNTPLSYNELKYNLGNYRIETINNKTTVYERKTNKVITNKRKIHNMTLADNWLKAIGGIRNIDKYEYIYNHLLKHEKIVGPITNVQTVFDTIDAHMKKTNEEKEAAKQIVVNLLLGKKCAFINHSLCPMEYKRNQNKVESYKKRYKYMTRSDGTNLFVFSYGEKQYLPNKNIFPVNKYDIIEAVKDKNGKQVIKKNRVYTENDLLKNSRPEIANYLLRRSRLDTKVLDTGSYIGYVNDEGNIYTNKEWVNHFEPSPRPSQYKIVGIRGIFGGGRSIVL